MTSPQRIVFIDVDGTILEHGSVIAPSTVSAIRRARSNGHLVYLCTGRSAGDIHPSVREIGFDGEITNGGAMGAADPALQALADRVTTGVLDDGVHNALVELGLA